VIIGAGLSGYAAATKLLENGVGDILVLEAEDRVGGRVHSIPHRGGRIDMGAQWVHGQGRNSIYEFVHENFEFGDTGFDSAYQYFHQSNGEPVNQRHCELLMNLSDKILFESFDEMSSFDHSIGDFFAMKYSRGLRDRSMAEVPWSLSRQIEDFSHSVVNNYFGSANWYDISAKLHGETEKSEGKQWLTWGRSGFATLFDFLAVS
jgi:phytoene dehydrogenase-like protein